MTKEQIFEALLRGEISLETVETMVQIKAWLKTLHTRQLMNMRYSTYYSVPDGLTHDDTHAMIVDELNTREHVPNKIEAKRIRQDRAKQSKSNRRSKS